MKLNKNVLQTFFSIFFICCFINVSAQRDGGLGNNFETLYFLRSATDGTRLKADTNSTIVPVKFISSTKGSNTTSSFNDVADIRIFPSFNMQATASISIDKSNPNNLLVSSETYTTSGNQGHYYSTNGGLTWSGQETSQNNGLFTYARPSTPYNTASRCFLSGENSVFLGVQSSTNAGANWGNMIQAYGDIVHTPVSHFTASDNEPASPYFNYVYSAWSLQDKNTGLSTQVVFNTSADNGNSFTYPPTVLKNGPGSGSNVQTGPNGEVYVCWSDRNASDPIWPYLGAGFCRSLDGGNTFTNSQRVINYTGIRDFFAPNPIFNNTVVEGHPTMAVDKSTLAHRGRIYIATNVKENGNGKAIVQVSYSDDKGDTWSSPVTVSIVTGRQNWNARIAVDDCSGDIWVVYYSFDTPLGFTTNTYLAHSADGGVTWENQKVSDVSHITAPINNNIFANGYAGWYNGIAAYQGKVYPVWSDNRSGNWQLYCSPITVGACAPQVSFWPKVYSTIDGYHSITKDNKGNIILWTSGIIGNSNYYNHSGLQPFNNINYQIFQFTNSGITNWMKETGFFVFAFKSGIVELTDSQNPVDKFYNGSSGVPVPSPINNLSPNEHVIAETNTGVVISILNNQLNSYLTPSSVPVSCNIGFAGTYIYRFNPNTNNLFVYGTTNANIPIFRIFNYSSGVLTPTFTCYPPANFGLVHLDNQDRCYYLNQSGLYQYDYVNNTIIQVNIPGFNNSNLSIFNSGNNYSSDKYFVFNYSDEKIYALDFSNNTCKKIQTVNFPGSLTGNTGLSYELDGDDFYLMAGEDFANQGPILIGSQNVPDPHNYSSVPLFVTKLSLNNDFSFFMAPKEDANKTFNNKSSIDVRIAPNPANNILDLTILHKNKNKIEKYLITVTSNTGRTVLRTNSTLNTKFDISGWPRGVYYVEVVDTKGERTNTSFIKL